MDVTAADCPACGTETVHDVEKQRGREQVLTCRDCGRTHPVVAPETVEVPVQLSLDEETTETEIEVAEDATISVGDRMFLLDGLAEVTAVEADDDRRHEALRADEIRTLWAKDIREVTIPVTVHQGRTSQSLETVAAPDRELAVGDRLDVEGRRYRIDRIKTDDDILRDVGETAKAVDVVRVYGDRAG